ALPQLYVAQEQEFEPNKIVAGKVRELRDDEVVIDVGYKSEGIVQLEEWRDEGTEQIVPPKIGDEIKVLLEAVEDDMGLIVLSYRKAKRQEEWGRIIKQHKEGGVVGGGVTRKIKSGLLVHLRVQGFFPASHVGI